MLCKHDQCCQNAAAGQQDPIPTGLHLTMARPVAMQTLAAISKPTAYCMLVRSVLSGCLWWHRAVRQAGTRLQRISLQPSYCASELSVVSNQQHQRFKAQTCSNGLVLLIAPKNSVTLISDSGRVMPGWTLYTNVLPRTSYLQAVQTFEKTRLGELLQNQVAMAEQMSAHNAHPYKETRSCRVVGLSSCNASAKNSVKCVNRSITGCPNEKSLRYE